MCRRTGAFTRTLPRLEPFPGASFAAAPTCSRSPRSERKRQRRRISVAVSLPRLGTSYSSLISRTSSHAFWQRFLRTQQCCVSLQRAKTCTRKRPNSCFACRLIPTRKSTCIKASPYVRSQKRSITACRMAWGHQAWPSVSMCQWKRRGN